MSFVHFLLQSQGAAQPNAAAGSFMMPVTLILVIGIFYFFMIRPENKKRKETEKQIAALKKGDKVVTIGGIHGTVCDASKEKTIVLKVFDGAKIEFNRSAISAVVTSKDDTKSADADKNDKEPVADENSAETGKTE